MVSSATDRYCPGRGRQELCDHQHTYISGAISSCRSTYPVVKTTAASCPGLLTSFRICRGCHQSFLFGFEFLGTHRQLVLCSDLPESWALPKVIPSFSQGFLCRDPVRDFLTARVEFALFSVMLQPAVNSMIRGLIVSSMISSSSSISRSSIVE